MARQHGAAERVPIGPHHTLQLLILVIAAAGLGCARGGESAPATVVLKVKLEQAAYRPGEAVLATVEAINNTGRPQTLNRLNAQSVVFMFGRQGDPERMERRAVASELENQSETMVLEPEETARREFLLTRLTQYPGALALQAHYTPGPLAEKIEPKIYSEATSYTVEGRRLFQRDGEGYIVKEEAIRVAAQAAGGTVEKAEAIFVRDEKGFYKWWVNLDLQGAPATAWLVDPYQGKPWHQAQRYDPRLAREMRFDRPEGLPEMRVPLREKQSNATAPPPPKQTPAQP